MIRKVTWALAFLTCMAAPGRGAEGGFGDAAARLEDGQTDAAVETLLAYARRSPAAPLANQALDCVLLLDQKKIPSGKMVPYLEALGLLADGFTATADVALRDVAADAETPWTVRARAYLVTSELDIHGDRLPLLEKAWADCPDESGRLFAVALAEAYYDAGRVKEALGVRREFTRRFPGDEGIRYFGYLEVDEEPR